MVSSKPFDVRSTITSNTRSPQMTRIRADMQAFRVNEEVPFSKRICTHERRKSTSNFSIEQWRSPESSVSKGIPPFEVTA